MIIAIIIIDVVMIEYILNMSISPERVFSNAGIILYKIINVMGPLGIKYIIENNCFGSCEMKCRVSLVIMILVKMKKVIRMATSLQFEFPSKNASSSDKFIPKRAKTIKEEILECSIKLFSRSEKIPL